MSVEVDYFGNPAASRQKVQDGWNRSGDVGPHATPTAGCTSTTASGGGIRRNGDFINPGFRRTTDRRSTRQVDDVYVYGVPARSGSPGEKDVVAAIVARDRASFDPQAVFAHCRAGLEPNFVPGYLQLLDEIPKTASEKPQERFLIELFGSDTQNVFTAD
jgi:crotonobetaine/carnitine-CoA ligase